MVREEKKNQNGKNNSQRYEEGVEWRRLTWIAKTTKYWFCKIEKHKKDYNTRRCKDSQASRRLTHIKNDNGVLVWIKQKDTKETAVKDGWGGGE